jgi:hypothetical protein
VPAAAIGDLVDARPEQAMDDGVIADPSRHDLGTREDFDPSARRLEEGEGIAGTQMTRHHGLPMRMHVTKLRGAPRLAHRAPTLNGSAAICIDCDCKSVRTGAASRHAMKRPPFTSSETPFT